MGTLWAYSYDEENCHGGYATKDEAVLEGFLNDPDIECLQVGTYEEWDAAAVAKQIGGYDGKRIMERVHEDLLDEAPEWLPDSWGDKLLAKEVCDKVNKFLAELVMEVQKPCWFEMSGKSEEVTKDIWLAEGNTVD